MGNNNFHEHINYMTLKMVCSFFFVCFMFVGVHSRRKKGGCFGSPDLGCELASSSRMVFVFHETSGEEDSN
jgi:hypothetical protein